MNHIYKVIFNKATGTFMAVAEYAKSHSGGGGVSSSATGQVGSPSVIYLTRVATLAILAIAAMFNSTVHATGKGGVAVGQMAGNGNKWASGKNAAADGSYSIAVGEYSTAKGDQSIAIGGGEGKGSASDALTVGATAKGKESIAIGGDVTAEADASVAIGSDDLYITDDNSQKVDQKIVSLIDEHDELKEIRSTTDTTKKYQRTQALGHASVSVGTMSKASGHFSNAFGTRAEADGAFSVAVGLTSKATGKSSVAVGSASKAKADQAIAIGSQTEAEGIGAIAIGADGKDTTTISANKNTISQREKTNKEHYKDIAGVYLEHINNLDPFATAKTKSKDGAIAIGSQAYGEGVWSNAFGVRARSEGFASTAVGTGSHAQGKGSVALGAGANATENWSVAIGAGSIAQGTGSSPTATTTAYDPSNTLTADQKGTDKYGVVSVGRDKTSDVVRRRITNVGAGASDTDAVNVAQLKAVEAIAKKAGGGGGTTTTVRADDGETHITVTQTTNGNSNEYKLKLDDNAKNAINKVNQITANVSDINKVNDGIGFTADVASNNGSSVKVTRKLGENIDIKGGKSSINDLTDNNIGVVASGTNLNIKLAKELNGLTKVAVTGNNTNAELLNGGLTFTQTGANAYKTVYGTDGLKFTTTNNSAKHQTVRITNEKIGFSGTDDTVANNLPYMHKDGINMTSKKITGLANGTADTDAVTIKQLKDAKPNITASTGINITNGNNGNLVDTNTGNVTTPTYTIGVKTTELSSNGNGANKFSVSDTNNNSALVTADKLKDYLNQVNQTADTASQTANNAKQEATTAKSTAEAAKSTANAATSTANQAQQSAQTAQQNAQKSATQAQTAQQQATQANQSAQQAKQQAATSAQQAQQAKTAAESAKSDATNAKTAAEAAKAAASNIKYKTSSSGTAQSLNVSDSKPLTFEQGDNITLEKSSDGTLKISSTASSNYKAWKLNTENGTTETINNNDEVKFIGKKTTTTTVNQPPHQNIKITQNTANKKQLEFALNDELKLNPTSGYLSVGNTTLNNGGLTVYKSDFTEQLQLGADGIKFADKRGSATIGVTKENSTRITSNGVGFSKVDGTLDENQPHIKASGINAGSKTISNVGMATNDTDAVNKGQVNKLIQEKIKPVELTVNDTPNGNNQTSPRFGVDDSNKDGFVTADKLKEYLNKVDQSADIAKTNAESANQQAADAKSESEKAKNEAAAAKTTANDNKTKLDNLGDTSQLKQNVDKALQTFKVQKDGDNTNTITVGKNSTASNNTVNTLKLKGENGLDVKTNKDGTVTFGVDTTKGLTTPKLTVSSNNGNGIVIDSQNGQNTITGLSSTLPSITNTGNAHTTAQGNTITNDKDKSNAASVKDVLNAGFNLQGNGNSVDFVSTYDTVNFTNGNATTAKVAYDEASKTSTVTYDVNVDDTTLTFIDGQNGKKQIGVKTTTLSSNGTGTNKFALSNQGNGDALVKASDIVTHLNTLSGDIQRAKGASQAGNSAGYVDNNGNKVIYDSTNDKYYQAKNDGTADKTKEVAKDKLVAQAQTPDGTLAQMNVKSVITKERENTANGINEDNAFVKGLEKAASNNKTKNAAVTVNDLHQVASTPLTFKSDDGVHSQVNLGDTFAMTGGADYKNLSDGKNIGVVSQPDGVQFKLAKDLKDLNSVSAGGTKIDEKGVSFVDSSGQAKANTPVLSANGLDMGGKVISNVGKGTKDTDAANMQQLNEVRSLLGLGNAGNGNAGSGNTGNAGNAGGGQVNIADVKKDPNSGSGSSSNSPAIKAGTVLGGKGNNDADKLANGGVQVGVDKDGNANGDLNNVWVKTQKDGSKKALLTTYNVEGQTNYVTNNPAEAIDKMNEQGIRFFHVNDGNQEPVVQGRNSIDSSASGRHSAAVGFQAKANGEAAVAVGRQTQAGNQSIAIGDKAQATGNQSIAIGTGNVVTGKHSGAIGDPSTVKADNSYSMGNNNQFTDATQTDVFGVGNNITVTESNSVALGSNSAISAGTQAGTQAKKSDGTAGKTTTAGATGTVKGFAGQTAVGAVSVGASGAERRIQNVAAGEVSATSTDAVNGSQLYKATQGIANATNELGHRIHQNENKANAGISSAMAMASMPQAYIPGRSMVTGGIATYNGQGAVAVGLSKLSDNGQWVFKINGSADTQGNAGAAVGAGFHW